MDDISRYMKSAEDYYDEVDFKTDKLFNEPPPEPWISFTIGAALSVVGIGMWLMRLSNLKKELAEMDPPVALSGNSLIRGMISCAIDSDSPLYVIVSYGAVCFLFLGAIQMDYQSGLFAMIIFYVVASLGESVRVLLAFSGANSLADVVVTSDLLKSKLRGVSTELKPSNVYEDLGRGRTIVIMVFVTQIILIAFVCIDVYENETTSCRDGSSGCPVGGTLGSWGFYVLGIFMACVFQLGPKTSFGQSEQNPAYWLQLLLATKQTGAKVTWYDPVEDKTLERHLTASDWRIWFRFVMSFLINGVGYHILVHALPIQVASQSSLTGVVFRAVGMMYLVDLDDCPGYTITIVQEVIEEKPDKKEDPNVPEKAEDTPQSGTPQLDTAELDNEARKIIEEARAKLDALARGTKPTKTRLTNHGLLAGGMIAAGEHEDGDEVVNGNNNDAGDETIEVGGRGLAANAGKKKDGQGDDALGADAEADNDAVEMA